MIDFLSLLFYTISVQRIPTYFANKTGMLLRFRVLFAYGVVAKYFDVMQHEYSFPRPT